MEEGNCSFGTYPEIFMDLDSMDELLLNGCWFETKEETNFMQHQQPSPSACCSASDYSPFCSSSSVPFDLIPHQILAKEAERKFLLPSSCLKIEESGGKTSTEKEGISVASTSLTQSVGFLDLQSRELGRRFWIGPSRNAYPDSSMRDRLVSAIGYLLKLMKEGDFLIQIWVPVKLGSQKFLTTEEQPYSFNPSERSLARYRDVSKTYTFAVEADSNAVVGLPGRVFSRKLPESTPDVRFFRSDEYPRLSHVRRYNVRGLLAVPVFERGSGTCLGVLEIVNTKQKIHYRPELHNICRALETVDLSSSHNLIPPIDKAYTTLYQAISSEVASAIESVCKSHNLPLALTWASSVRQGKSRSHHSEDNYSPCLSTVDSACFVTDEDSRSFLSACSEHHLLPGEGIVGRAFVMNKHCFATDVRVFSKINYPLSHHARMFGYHAALAIPLRSKHGTGPVELVIELFFPKDCLDIEAQKQMFDSLSTMMHRHLQGSNLVMEKEPEEEVILPSTALVENPNLLERQTIGPEESPWISQMMEANRRGQGVAISWEFQKEEPIEEEFKVPSGHWDATESSLVVEKRKRKEEKAITLDVLRKHFAGSLKDAAKTIGVCPTTLKRICRQHGIKRWPSRKIQKVGHSLHKLQLVMDSVQGIGGSIKLNSFYSSFPELSSPGLTTHFDISSCLRQSNSEPESGGGAFKHATLFPKSPPSSSGSQSSFGSSACNSTGIVKSYTIDVEPLCSTSTEDDGGLPKRTQSHPQQLTLSLPERPHTLLARPNPRVGRETSLPPLPATSPGKVLRGSNAIKVKATFGESKLRLSLQQNWGYKDLRKEIAERFALDTASNFHIKYLDDDREWVLLACDADLEECIDIYKSCQSRTIRISVHQPLQRKQRHP